jgi:pyruvate kinase
MKSVDQWIGSDRTSRSNDLRRLMARRILVLGAAAGQVQDVERGDPELQELIEPGAEVNALKIARPVPLPSNKTKIVATIGPASESPEMLQRLVLAGMNVARLNFSHGDFASHAGRIARIRDAEKATGRRVAIMADLPGPKMRVGKIEPEPIQLVPGGKFTLTSDDVVGNEHRVGMSFARLPAVVKKGDRLFLNDGLVQLVVEEVAGSDVRCKVAVGGELRSRKGLNLPGIDLGISAFTDHDRACLEFALENGVDAVSQSFVETASDIEAVRTAARARGKNPFIIAKIERSGAIRNFEAILQAADGIMVARGDLGVEVPIEQMAILQKQLIDRASHSGKPVITATQMLESMTASRLPTRAESTDVANAVLDGTDCIMLSGESAVGKYPEEAVAMLARIAAYTEAHRPRYRTQDSGPAAGRSEPATAEEAVASVVEHALETVPCAAVFVPTRTGAQARMISRFNPAAWIVAMSRDAAVLQGLAFSYGVHPVEIADDTQGWNALARNWLREHRLPGKVAIIVTGPSTRTGDAEHRLAFLANEHARD